jgi:hypothetical protein
MPRLWYSVGDPTLDPVTADFLAGVVRDVKPWVGFHPSSYSGDQTPRHAASSKVGSPWDPHYVALLQSDIISIGKN